MSRNLKPSGQNLRLAVVAAFAVVAIGTTFAAASDDLTELDGNDTASSIRNSAPDPVSSTTITAPLDVTPTVESASNDDTLDAAADPTEFGAAVVEVDGRAEGVDGFVIVGASDAESEGELADDEVMTCASPEPAPSVDDAFFSETFDNEAAAWDALSGSWSVVDGSYQQADPAGYDLISQLRVDPPEQFRISVSVRPLGDGLGGGLVLAQPLPAERAGATVVDFTDGGSFLRWGRYDTATGQYSYLGGVSLGEDFDPSVPHELTVEVRAERTMVMVDGIDVGTFEALGYGRVGVVTSRSIVAFDDVRIVEVGA